MPSKQIMILVLAAVAMVVGGNLAYRMYLARSPQPTAAPVVGDKDLKQEVEGKLASSALFTGEKISVTVQGGVVTLAGTLHDDWKRTSAANMAASVTGVSAVKNTIKLREAAQAPQAVWKAGKDAAEPAAPEMARTKRERRAYVDPAARAQELVAEGNYQVSQKNYDAAIKAFREALALDGGNYAAQSGLQEAQRMR